MHACSCMHLFVCTHTHIITNNKALFIYHSLSHVSHALTEGLAVEAGGAGVAVILTPVRLVGARRTPCLIVTAHQAEVAGATGQVCGATGVLAARAEVASVTLTGGIVQPVRVAVVAGSAGEAVCDVGATCEIWGPEGILVLEDL